jgi:hypothetical protein
MPGMGGAGAPALDSAAVGAEAAPAEMTEEEARAIVAKAAEAGKISGDEAQKLLESAPAGEAAKDAGGISKLWKKLSGKTQ